MNTTFRLCLRFVWSFTLFVASAAIASAESLIIDDAVFAHDFEMVSGDQVTGLKGPAATKTPSLSLETLHNGNPGGLVFSPSYLRAPTDGSHAMVDTNTRLTSTVSGLSFSIRYNDRGDNGNDADSYEVVRLLSSYAGSGSGGENQTAFGIQTSGGLRKLSLYTKQQELLSSVSIPAQDSLWHHAGFTFDAGVVTFYFDGQPLGTPQTLSGVTSLSAQDLDWHLIEDGPGGNVVDEYFDGGSYDEAALWNRSLTPWEMLLLAHQGVAGANINESSIRFTGGGEEPLTVSFLQDIVIPITAAPDSAVIDVVLENVYSSNQGTSEAMPITPYVDGVQTEIGSPAVSAEGYGNPWGTSDITTGIRDPNDFQCSFSFGAIPTEVVGSNLVIKAGSVEIPSSSGIVRPDLPVSTIQLRSGGTSGLPLSSAVYVPGSEPPAQSPVIISNPAAVQTQISGMSVTLAVEAGGYPLPTYQWYRGVSGDVLNEIPGATSAIYTTPVLMATQDYWVRATNSEGFADSATATVTVVSNNTDLQTLEIAGASAVTPVAGARVYQTTVAHATESVTISATTVEDTSEVVIAGVPVGSGGTSGALPLAVGPNVFEIVVTAEFGNTSAYTMIVNRENEGGGTDYVAEFGRIIDDAVFAHDFEVVDGDVITALVGPDAVKSTGISVVTEHNGVTDGLAFSPTFLKFPDSNIHHLVASQTRTASPTGGLSFSIFYNGRGDNGSENNSNVRLLSAFAGSNRPSLQPPYAGPYFGIENYNGGRHLVFRTQYHKFYSTETIPEGDAVWHQAGFTFDEGLLRFYFDGQRLGEAQDLAAIGLILIPAQDLNWAIGEDPELGDTRRGGVGDEYFDNGSYDEAALWERALRRRK